MHERVIPITIDEEDEIWNVATEVDLLPKSASAHPNGETVVTLSNTYGVEIRITNGPNIGSYAWLTAKSRSALDLLAMIFDISWY